MTILGNFTKQKDSYEGSIATLALKAKLTIVPTEKTGENAPDFRVYMGKAEFGAAWSTTSKAGKPYLNIRFNDPALAAGFFRLVETKQGYALTWNL